MKNEDRMKVRLTREMREEGVVHPTRALIIRSTTQIMKEKSAGEVHIDDVLAATGLTRGALYHHFKNVDDLVESALLATYAEGVGANIAYVRETLDSATTPEEFRNGVLQANTAYAKNERLRDVRKLRAHAMAASAGSPTLARALADEQQRLTDEYVTVITEAKRRGWVRSEVDPLALAVFIQAYSFGVIVDDLSHSHVDTDEWARLIAGFFEKTMFG